MYRVLRNKSKFGENCYILDERGRPELLSTLFIQQNYKKLKTQESVAYSLMFFYILLLRFRERPQSLIKENFIDERIEDDINAFSHVKLKYLNFEKPEENVTNFMDPLKLAQHAFNKNRPRDYYINPVTANIRLVYIRKFIKWISSRYGPKRKYGTNLKSTSEHIEYRKKVDDFNSWLSEWIKAESPPHGDSLEAASKDIVEKIKYHLNPENCDLWTNEITKLRNILIFHLYLSTGARRTEILNLKYQDINFGSAEPLRLPEFTITGKRGTRNVYSNLYTQELIERFKKLSRRIPSTKDKKEGYILLSLGGSRISYNSIQRVFENIRNNIDGVPEWFSPHTLRRYWTENYMMEIEEMQKNGILSHYTEGDIISNIRVQLGHKNNSTATDLYKRKKDRESVNNALLEIEKERRKP